MGRCKPWPTPLRRVADRGIAKARFCFRPPATGLCIGFRYADPMIFLAVERAHVYASHIRWTGHPEQKVMPVGQKLRETMAGVLSPLSDGSAEFVPPNHILLVRERVLYAQRFDPVKMELAGEPFPVASGVSGNWTNYTRSTASDTGLIA